MATTGKIPMMGFKAAATKFVALFGFSANPVQLGSQPQIITAIHLPSYASVLELPMPISTISLPNYTSTLSLE